MICWSPSHLRGRKTTIELTNVPRVPSNGKGGGGLLHSEMRPGPRLIEMREGISRNAIPLAQGRRPHRQPVDGKFGHREMQTPSAMTGRKGNRELCAQMSGGRIRSDHTETICVVIDEVERGDTDSRQIVDAEHLKAYPTGRVPHIVCRRTIEALWEQEGQQTRT